MLVIEDGPTLTHGGMTYGGEALQRRAGCGGAAEPRPRRGSIAETLASPRPARGLPAMGYSAHQMAELEPPSMPPP